MTLHLRIPDKTIPSELHIYFGCAGFCAAVFCFFVAGVAAGSGDPLPATLFLALGAVVSFLAAFNITIWARA